MSDCLVVEDYSDRRRHSRRSVYRSAELMLRGGGEGHDCTVIDESAGGVQVELSEPLDLPEEGLIKFSDTASQLVRRCWAKGNRAGYQYIEIVPAARRIVSDVPPPPREVERGSFVAFNDFIHISRQLLDLSAEPPEWVYPAEQIHALLWDVPDARSPLPELFAFAPVVAGELGQNFFGASWAARV